MIITAVASRYCKEFVGTFILLWPNVLIDFEVGLSNTYT